MVPLAIFQTKYPALYHKVSNF